MMKFQSTRFDVLSGRVLPSRLSLQVLEAGTFNTVADEPVHVTAHAVDIG